MKAELFENLVNRLNGFEPCEGECDACSQGMHPVFWLREQSVLPTVDFSDQHIHVLMPAPEWDESEPHWSIRVEKEGEDVHDAFYTGPHSGKPTVIARGETVGATMKWLIENIVVVHLTNEECENAFLHPAPAIAYNLSQVLQLRTKVGG